jgi:AcrR family transcriptional regulator
MDRTLAPAREALLRAALSSFAAHGFKGASTRAIAAAAGVNQGLIRHHFGSKEGLWRELIERGVRRLMQALQHETLTAVLADRAADNPHLALVHMIVHALLAPGARREWLVRTRLEPLRRVLLAGASDAAHAAPRFPPHDVLLLACLGLEPSGTGAGPWARALPVARAVGPWSTGSTPAGAS